MVKEGLWCQSDLASNPGPHLLAGKSPPSRQSLSQFPFPLPGLLQGLNDTWCEKEPVDFHGKQLAPVHVSPDEDI